MSAAYSNGILYEQEEPYYPDSEKANKHFAIANCFQNVNAGERNWATPYCVSMTFEWIGYLVLTCSLTFLLSLHCLMYKRINNRWSWRIFTRNRVQILTLSVLLTGTLFVKETFIMKYADLVLLLGA